MKVPEHPIIQSLVLCDQVVTDVTTSKRYLLGVFTSIWANSFPAKHGAMTLYAAFTNGRGSGVVSLKLKREDGSQDATNELFRIDHGSIEFDNPLQIVECQFDLRNVVFLQSGVHSFEVYFEEDFLSQIRFTVQPLRHDEKD